MADTELTDNEAELLHTIDGLCIRVATLRRAAANERRLLIDALDALRDGRAVVAEEFLDRAIAGLTKALDGTK